MAVPVLVGRSASRTSAPPEAAASTQVRVRSFSHSYAWIVLALTLAGLVSRVYTTNSLAGEPTPDEYLYAVHARDLARGWAAGEPVSLVDSLGVEGRSVAVESAALSFMLPWDPLTIGRTLQAAFNALCVPATFVLGRYVGMSRSASLAGAVLLMAVPEFQEFAWRFWTDSQATFLSLVYLAALIAYIRRPSLLSATLGLACLGLLLLTKESVAVTFSPFVVLAVAIPLGRRLSRPGRLYAALAVGLALVAIACVGVLLARAPGELARSALLQKTFGAGPLIVYSVRDAIPRIPQYSQQLVTLMGPAELGTGFLWATLVGFTWLLAQSAVALVTNRPRLSSWVLGWLVATLVWLPAMITPWRDLASLHQTDAWVAVAAAALLVSVGTVELYLRNGRRTGWALALLGLVVVAVLAERLLISVTPSVSAAALSFRELMPIVPLFALVAGGGIWGAAGALGLLIPGANSARAVVAVVTCAVVVTFWSPLLRERLSGQPMLGRVADRGADVTKAEGLRVEALVGAQAWLHDNLQHNDLILTGIPRQLAWYADMSADDMDNLINLLSQDRDQEQRRAYILDRVGPQGVMYVIDFNVDWTDPGGDKAKQWRQTYELLAGKPNLEVAYLLRDRYNNPVFYVIRNHGYALAPGH
ncbi:MAG: hypothetical protein M3069_12040 [Chloroflexota bacterium]|nr:hypothetical protein [Chloroflexota bacterium]